MVRLWLAVACALAASPLHAQVSQPRAAAAVASSLVVKLGTALVAGVNVTSGASAGYVMIFDGAAAPADGAVTPLKCVPLAANTGIDINYRASPLRLQTGAVIVFSTTGCYTKTASATAFISGDIQ